MCECMLQERCSFCDGSTDGCDDTRYNVCLCLRLCVCVYLSISLSLSLSLCVCARVYASAYTYTCIYDIRDASPAQQPVGQFGARTPGVCVCCVCVGVC